METALLVQIPIVQDVQLKTLIIARCVYLECTYIIKYNYVFNVPSAVKHALEYKLARVVNQDIPLWNKGQRIQYWYVQLVQINVHNAWASLLIVLLVQMDIICLVGSVSQIRLLKSILILLPMFLLLIITMPISSKICTNRLSIRLSMISRVTISLLYPTMEFSQSNILQVQKIKLMFTCW